MNNFSCKQRSNLSESNVFVTRLKNLPVCDQYLFPRMPAFYLFNFFSRFQILVREPRIRDVIELIVLFGEGIQLCSPNESSMYKEKETLMVHW